MDSLDSQHCLHNEKWQPVHPLVILIDKYCFAKCPCSMPAHMPKCNCKGCPCQSQSLQGAATPLKQSLGSIWEGSSRLAKGQTEASGLPSRLLGGHCTLKHTTEKQAISETCQKCDRGCGFLATHTRTVNILSLPGKLPVPELHAGNTFSDTTVTSWPPALMICSSEVAVGTQALHARTSMSTPEQTCLFSLLVISRNIDTDL